MAGITRTVHPTTSFDWGPVDKFCPEMEIRVPGDDGGSQPRVPDALAFLDPDGETHVFVFTTDDARKLLIAKLTGGIVLARPGDGEPLGPVG